MDVGPDFAIFFHPNYFQLWTLDTAIRARGKYINFSASVYVLKKYTINTVVYKTVHG
jgi:hypothetical protein